MDDGTQPGMPAWNSPTPLVQSAMAMRELYQALRQAGFTEDQALRLTAYTAGGAGAPAPPV